MASAIDSSVCNLMSAKSERTILPSLQYDDYYSRIIYFERFANLYINGVIVIIII